jgi:hypothetical protein
MKYTLYPQRKSAFDRLGKPTILTAAIGFAIYSLPWLLLHTILLGIAIGEKWALL